MENKLKNSDVKVNGMRKLEFRLRASTLEKKEVGGVVMVIFLMLCFWIVSQMETYWKANHSLVSIKLMNLMFKDFKCLVFLDALLIITSFMAVLPLKIALFKTSLKKILSDRKKNDQDMQYVSIKPPPWWVYSVRHVFQAGLLILCVKLMLKMEFRWVQRTFIVMHSFVLVMKMHSYVTSNLEAWENRALQVPKSGLDVGAQLSIYEDFPNNVGFYDYGRYLLFPTLCYDSRFPRTRSIDWIFVLQKSMGVFVALCVIYVTVAHHMEPQLLYAANTNEPLWRTTLHMIVPTFIVHVSLFLLVFECLLNAVAELTYFGDREFYLDWWNSTNHDEYARKWNKPVHSFLLHYVYQRIIRSFHLKKSVALSLTFFFSSVLHELVMSLMLGRICYFMFLFQMSQIPLLMLTRSFRGTRMGNGFFWTSILVGPAILIILCVRGARFD